MLYAPGIWLHLPHWMIPVLASGGVVALIYRIFTELIDGIAGALGALLTVSIPIFREQSIMVMAQVPALLGALLLIWAWLKWRESRSLATALFAGVIAGWLAVTRPVDALAVIIPVLIAFIFDLRRERGSRRIWVIFACLAGVAPFLVIQLVFNHRVTGSFFETPFDFFTRQVYPHATYGFHGDNPADRPTWPLPQIQQAYDELAKGFLRNHTPAQKLLQWRVEYLPNILQMLCPHSLLIVLLPVGFLGLRGRRWLIAAIFPLFVLFYFPYVFFIKHYALTVIPCVLMMILLGVRVLSDRWAWFRPHVLTFLVIGISALLISGWPPFDRVAADEFFTSDALRSIDAQLSNLPHRPAIVLFRFSSNNAVDLEPVYNADVVWPDDAPIIRAHDRGEKNVELFRYYATRQPDRWVYLFDQANNSITELGPVTKLAEASR